MRDEYKVLMPGVGADTLANNVFLLEEFLATEYETGRLQLDLKPIAAKQVLLHGHCHQKAFNVMAPVEKVLSLIPELKVKTIDSSCCGMAGSFGYEKEHYDISMKMGSLSLFPAVKEADTDVLIVADGTSCRSQIEHGTGRQAMHVARVLQMALNS
jgi:Fe-S oxidoreductase